MIPRTRPASASPARAELHLAPNGGPADFHPTPLPGGWTPEAAFDAADDYAEGERGARARAYVALLGAVPGLHRADVVARLRGVDFLRDVELDEPDPTF